MITVVGYSPSLDLTYLVDDLVPGAIHRPTAVVAVAGGKSLNLTRAAAALGADVGAVAVLGGPTGWAVRGKLEADGVDVTVVTSPLETRTCVSIASATSTELTEIYQHATPIPGDVWPVFVRELDRVLAARPGWLAISGGAPPGLERGAVADLVRLGDQHRVRVAVDVHGSALPDAVAARPALVKINRYEAAELLGCPADAGLVEMAEQIAGRTGGQVVLTDGAAGAVAVESGARFLAAAPSIRGQFSVGSGDSFLGGLLAALERDERLDSALRHGMAAGIANALEPGAGRLSAATATELAGSVEVSTT